MTTLLEPKPSPLPLSESRAGRDDGDQWALLAFIRFFLSLTVCATHHCYVVPDSRDLPAWVHFLQLMGGDTSVLGFFLISGYSISASIARDKTQYARRRFWRIYPVYVFCALYGLTPYIISHGEFGTPVGFWRWPDYPTFFATFFAVPFIATESFAGMNVAWSLTCEIVYYAAAPILAKLRPIGLAAVVIVSIAIYGWQTHFVNVFDIHQLWGLTPLAMAWIWVLAFGYYRYRVSRYAPFFLVALPLACYVYEPSEVYSRITLFIVIAGLVFAQFVRLPDAVARIANFLGDVSYPMYLSQITTLFTLYLLWPHFMSVHTYLYMPATLAVAVLITILWDYPTRRYAKYRAQKRNLQMSAVTA